MTHFFVAGAGRVGRLGLVALALGVAGPAAGQGFSNTRTDYATGGNPRCIVVADVNADGRPDLITANRGVNTVSVRLASGAAGNFDPVFTDYYTGFAPSGLAVADVNGDGRPDLVTANTAGNSVSVRLADSAVPGRFELARTDYLVGTGPNSVAVADVNADGRPDLVTASGGGLGVCLAAGAAGAFVVATTSALHPGITHVNMALVDVNADGRPDIVLAPIGYIDVGVGLANPVVPGTFLSSVSYGALSYIRSLAVADVNGDGRPDLVTSNQFDDVIVRLAAGAAGAFAATYASYPTDNDPTSVAVVDVNADGRPDLVTATPTGAISVRLAAGPAGAFATTRTTYYDRSGFIGTLWDLTLADVNADGRPDIITVDERNSLVGIRLNTGTLATAPALASPAATLYPNPTGGAAAVSLRLPAAAGPPPTAALLDALGRVLRPARALAVADGQATGTLPTAGLPPGVYLLRLSSSAGTRCQRLVVE